MLPHTSMASRVYLLLLALKMKLQHMDSSLGRRNTGKHKPLLVLLATSSLLLLATFPLYYPLLGYPIYLLHNYTKSSSLSSHDSYIVDLDEESLMGGNEECDIFSGEWVPNPKAPYYTNTTCWAIHEHQNCMKYGRPDSEFMKWRWKPDGCELPLFNPAQFLEILRGKSMAFVGDSVSRNQMQSLICLLSRVEYPIDVSYTKDEHFKLWNYTTYNFTIASFWTPHLVNNNEADPDDLTHSGLFRLYLDEPNKAWTTQIAQFDYVIISAGHWFFRPMKFYENRQLVGCHFCQIENVTDLTMYYGYRKAFRSAFEAINGLKDYKGVTFLRTYAPSHFENGIWNKGGNCVRKKPFKSNETLMEGAEMEMYMIQLEEFKIAKEKGREKGLRFRLMDLTQAMWLRPDGHPSNFGHWPEENVTLYNDCVHWCLPGPIDSWSDFLLQMLKTEAVKSHEEKLHSVDRKMRF